MKLGVFGLNSKATMGSAATKRMAQRCEALGYESWWAGEHVILPSPQVPPSPMQPDDPILDPLVHLAFVAAATENLLLGSGIIILPQRNPLVLAKQVATLDRVSDGRFQLGIGVGYLEPELNAIGVTLSERGSRTDDALGAMRAIWYDPAPVSFTGAHTSFAGMDAHPRPIGTIPIVVGGTTKGAHRRAIEQGHGWYGFFLTPDQAAENVRALATLQHDLDRQPALGELEISVTPPRPLTADSLQAYADAGVHRLIVYPLPVEDEPSIDRYLAEHADLVV
jgi:probable F420-dependent oxidoreductase